MNSSNQITYEYFCVLGGLANPRCGKRLRQNGSYIYFTYHLLPYTGKRKEGSYPQELCVL